jgi:REP element-mobilizing transposase RayT
MARPLRIEIPGALYHVTSRGDRREAIVDDDADRELWLDVLGRTLTRYDGAVLAYCLMDNHYHLVLHTRRANLSRIMRDVNGIYTQAYNRAHGTVGHLFQGRFKAILVDRDPYLLEVCRYVDLNPVRAGVVDDPAHWPWSSYRALTGAVAVPPWLDAAALHGALLGNEITTTAERRRARRRYEAFVAQGKGVQLWDAALRQQIYLGDESFVQRMQSHLEPAKYQAREIPKAQRTTRARTVAQYLKAARSRDEGIARAHREGGHSLSTIASEVGLSVSRVSRIVATQAQLGQANSKTRPQKK